MSELQEPIQLPQQDINAILDENRRLKEQYAYDNEWISFLAKLAENDSIKDIVDFIDQNKWTDRQKVKIMSFAKVMLGRGLSTTFITGITDYRRVFDDYDLCELMLILGMTVYDITPEWNELMHMIRLHFGLEIRRSKGGHFIERLGTQRTEFVHDSQNRTPEGFKAKLWERFAGE